ncbi:MAG TPA: hypothetical protein VNP92_08575 [Actinophytocola sp.]|nr:hypothetical protein [Actinophytocola sp.]
MTVSCQPSRTVAKLGAAARHRSTVVGVGNGRGRSRLRYEDGEREQAIA